MEALYSKIYEARYLNEQPPCAANTRYPHRCRTPTFLFTIPLLFGIPLLVVAMPKFEKIALLEAGTI